MDAEGVGKLQGVAMVIRNDCGLSEASLLKGSKYIYVISQETSDVSAVQQVLNMLGLTGDRNGPKQWIIYRELRVSDTKNLRLFYPSPVLWEFLKCPNRSNWGFPLKFVSDVFLLVELPS